MSPEDYQACVKHRWRWKPSGKQSTKEYLVRNRQVFWDNGGQVRHNRTQQDLFLHAFIMERMGVPRPSPRHVCDHRDGSEVNCTRENLRWVTRLFNAINIGGRFAGVEFDTLAATQMPKRQLLEAIKEIQNGTATATA